MKKTDLPTIGTPLTNIARILSAPNAAPPKCAYSIPDFCESIGGITRQHFHALIKRGKGPRFFKVGRRTLIGHEAAMEWIKRMEQETSQDGSE